MPKIPKVSLIAGNLRRFSLTYLLRPGIPASRPNKSFPHDLVEHCISYFFGIVQLSVSLGGVNVCSSWSTSIWVTMLGLPKQHFRSSLFIVTTAMAS